MIRIARVEDIKKLNELCLRAKAHWGYSKEFMALCREELLISKEDILNESLYFYVKEQESQISGFYCLKKESSQEFELDGLYVEPEFIGGGIGHSLMSHAKKKAAESKVSKLMIQSDPHALGFYLKEGAIETGQKESGSIPGRMLPILTLEI